MELPSDFLKKYEHLLGEDFADFLATFDAPAQSGFRINPLKVNENLNLSEFEKLPDSEFGYYGKLSGKSAALLTGLAYSQEPAAQAVVELAKPFIKNPNVRVLDLCAAPGGKSTQLLSYLADTGLLVSNEVSAKRAKALVENLERWSARNTVVLNESPANLATVFPDFFDLVLVDAPCSGEGMFRKDPEAVQYWSESYVRECALRQREILTEAVKMLKPGGKLVYSTCTWSPEEDEEQVDWLSASFESLAVVEMQKFWPHRFRGEGQFVALLQDKTYAAGHQPVKSGQSNLTSNQRDLWQSFAAAELKVKLNGLLQVFGDHLYLLPADLPDVSKLKIARNGLHLGVFKKNRFEPSFALGMALHAEEVRQTVALDDRQFPAYLAGNPLKLEQPTEKGWAQVLVGGNGLGFAKVVNGVLKNYYPKGLRNYG